MAETTFYLDRDRPESLQTQLRQRIIDSILLGSLAPGDPMPSSRRLAESLGIARNTVMLTYDQLVADGYLVGRERRGVFVGELLLEGARPRRADEAQAGEVARPALGRMQTLVRVDADWRPPPNWRLNPYPFVDGTYDASLSHLAGWRDAVRVALGASEFADWNHDFSEVDDQRLVHEIRTKALPRRGIQARPEEILITSGARHAMGLLCRALVGRGTKVAMEEPGFPAFYQLLRMQGASVLHQPVDADGILVDERLDPAEVIFVTPGCQYPTGGHLPLGRRKALLARARRGDKLVIEYDLPMSGGFADKAEPALYPMDGSGRVIYLADLCDVLTPGLGIGFVVAEAGLIRDLRKLRTLAGGAVPRSAQRIASHFLSLGHYDATIARLNRVLRERLHALRDGLNYYLPQLVATDPRYNGGAMWVEGPADLSARLLATEAAKRGILIEACDQFYAAADRPVNRFRMGVTGIPRERIREGAAALAKVLEDCVTPTIHRLNPAVPAWLDEAELRALMPGIKLLGRTTYGDPYEIDVRPDGTLIGKAGYAHEDCDTGRWWIEGDRWCRQWTEWVYGDVARFMVVVEGSEMRWYRSDLGMFNRLVIGARAAAEPARAD